MKPVRTKRDFVRRYIAGEFGNHTRSWQGIDDCPCLGMENYHIRNRIIGGPTWYNVCGEHLRDMWEAVCSVHADPANLYISEMAPTPYTTIQGEVIRSPQGLYLYYNQVPLPMRDGFRIERKEAFLVKAKELLRHYLCDNSWEWMQHLLDSYPDHVVEFSSYSQSCGTLPNHNTLFWEIRAY